MKKSFESSTSEANVHSERLHHSNVESKETSKADLNSPEQPPIGQSNETSNENTYATTPEKDQQLNSASKETSKTTNSDIGHHADAESKVVNNPDPGPKPTANEVETTNSDRKLTTPDNAINSPDVTTKFYITETVINKKEQQDLSSLGHKKRFLKPPPSPFKHDQPKQRRIAVSEFEKEAYRIGTTKPRGKDEDSPECVHIGRDSITHSEFALMMRSNKWVGSFAMNVYCASLAYNQSKEEKPKIRKGFLSSYQVAFLMTPDPDTATLEKRFRNDVLGFELDKVDMIMIPVCRSGHWWLIVANMRDNRFYVLSSCPFRHEDREMASTVRSNFIKAFTTVCKDSTHINVAQFDIAFEDAPQQNTINDCGIFVMEFMKSWDGRRAAPVDNAQIYSLRVKACTYLLAYPANTEVLPDIKKLIQKHKDGRWAKGTIPV